jgi:hypothetical protein
VSNLGRGIGRLAAIVVIIWLAAIAFTAGAGAAPANRATGFLPSTTQLAISPGSVVGAQPYTLTATVSGDAPSGTVTFFSNGQAYATVPLTYSGVTTAVLTVVPTFAGSISWQAVYNGDPLNNPSQSPFVAETVMPDQTTTTLNLVAPPGNTVYPGSVGNPYTVTAWVTNGTSATPTGTVTFFNGLGQPVQTVALSGGSATMSVTPTAAGTDLWQATYNGDPLNLTSQSSIGAEAVQGPTTTTLTFSPNPVPVGQPYTVNAAVVATTGTAATAPTGLITFFQGSQPIQTVALNGGHASLTATSAVGGSVAWHAIYLGDTYNITSQSAPAAETVQGTTTASLIASPATVTVGQPYNLVATITGSDAIVSGNPITPPTGPVTFTATQNGQVVQTQSLPLQPFFGTDNATVGFSVVPTRAGAISWQATYGGDGNNLASQSAIVTETVNALASTTTVNASAGASVVYGQTVSFTATVAGASGANPPTGTVQFQVDGANLGGPVPLTNGSATSTAINTLVVGTHPFAAVYSGDSTFNGSTGSASQTITPAPLTVTANDQTMVYGGPVPPLTASVSGLVNGDLPSVVSGLSCLALDAQGNPVGSSTLAGTYAINCSGGAASNYQLSYQPGTLTIKLFAPGGLLVLSSSSTKCHLLLNSGASVTAGTVAVDGTSSGAACLNSATLSATSIAIQGGVTNNQSTVNGTLNTQQPFTPDPLGSLPVPSTASAACPGAACPNGTTVKGGATASFYPGTYTHAISVNTNGVACLAPGVYVLKANWTVSAALRPFGASGCPSLPAGQSDPGVLLFFQSGTLALNAGSDLSELSAPATGPYAGLFYWQVGTNAVTLNAPAANGAWYEPHGALVLNSNVKLTAPLVTAATLTVDTGASLSVSGP